ncbi:hypothetical protein HUW46_02292 [Amycolatopsis sp. CA-230715]|nr:hypothetical protein HUW46_02292 [Amycolatopsis sp. CA-230715]
MGPRVLSKALFGALSVPISAFAVGCRHLRMSPKVAFGAVDAANSALAPHSGHPHTPTAGRRVPLKVAFRASSAPKATFGARVSWWSSVRGVDLWR